MKRIKTDKPGVFYRIGQRIGGSGEERIYYVVFKKDGKLHEEKVGRQYADQMTPAKASKVRADLIEGRRMLRKEKIALENEKKKLEIEKPIISRLWAEYKTANPHLKGIVTDQNRFKNHLEPTLGKKTPEEIIALDIDRIKRKSLKGKAPATVWNTLELLRRIVNFGIKRNRCSGMTFKLEMPTVSNETTEDLSTKELARLLEAIENDGNTDVANIMKLALYTGMRRSEIFRLEHRDLNFETGFIKIRSPKGGKDVSIPMNQMARELLENQLKRKASPYVFPGRGGKQRVCVKKAVNRIKEKAGIPKEFRALHGLRHVYASMLASSGKVDMYVLQKLMTHKSPKMTQRYANLRDEALKNGAAQIDDIFKSVGQSSDKKDDDNVVNLK